MMSENKEKQSPEVFSPVTSVEEPGISDRWDYADRRSEQASVKTTDKRDSRYQGHKRVDNQMFLFAKVRAEVINVKGFHNT